MTRSEIVNAIIDETVSPLFTEVTDTHYMRWYEFDALLFEARYDRRTTQLHISNGETMPRSMR